MAKPKYINLILFILLAVVLIFSGYMILKSPGGVVKDLTDSELNFNSDNPKNTLKDSIVAYGIQLLDTPYVVEGSDSNGFDCSGYVYYVFQNFDIDVPRSTSAYGDFGKEISVEDVDKGDLLLFLSPTRNAIGHIGIVSTADGAKSEFIHATSGKAMKVTITSLSNEGYKRRFVKAIRVI